MAQAIAVASESPLASALRKARWRLLPLLSICYLVAYMDRANISFAADTMNRDLHFSPSVYGLGAGLFFISYALCELPSNRALLHFGARRWMARIMFTWGLLAGAMVLVHAKPSFYILRLLLGAAEAGYFPGVLFYLSQWFPAAERARAISRFYVTFALSNVVMGLAAGVLLKLNGRLGLAGWQWLFLVEAAPAVLLSFVILIALPDGPSAASWLNSEERAALQTELYGSDSPAHESQEDLWRAVRTFRVWRAGMVYLFGLGSFYALTFSLPTVLGQITGWSATNVGYLISIMGAVGAILMLFLASFSDRKGDPAWLKVVCLVLMGGCLLAAGLHFYGIFAAVLLLLSIVAWYAIQGPLLSMATFLMPGRLGAIAIAIINMCGMVGGFLGPYWMGWMRERTGSYAIGISALAIPIALAIACLLSVTQTRGDA